MTPQQYQLYKQRLGKSHPQMGELIGVSRRQSQRYALGEDRVPKCIGIVVKLLAQGKIKEDELR
jgi:hypothetical protein